MDKFWNSRTISLKKENISRQELEENTNEAEIRSTVKANEKEARELLFSFPDLDREATSFFEAKTLMDGSVDISGMELASDFLKREESLFREGPTTTTRGYNYICSLDVSLTSMQKIRKYQETISAVARELHSKEMSKIEKLLLLDYLKNALITILNSLIYQEKSGSEYVDTSEEYEELRRGMIEEAQSVIGCSVDLLLNKGRSDTESINFVRMEDLVGRVATKLRNYDTQHKFPSFYVSRPEVTHPMTIIGASLLNAKRYQNVGTVVGLPSGGTELALTTKILMDRMTGKDTHLVLLPMSLHSLKNSARKVNNGHFNKQGIKKYLANGDSPVLVCDDNTSTGRTLQMVKDLTVEAYPGKEVYCSVAEADVVRSQIDKEANTRTHVANKDIYSDAVNILPVSKSIAPKVDLKELIERRKIIRYYENMQNEATNLVNVLCAKVLGHVNESGMDYTGFTEENSIPSFRGTFLSNFYAVPVHFYGRSYPSVEHAYQGAKFTELNWSTISSEAKDEIREVMRSRGVAAELVYDEKLFTDNRMAAGHTKIIADILRKYGYVNKGWGEKRIKVMLELLLQKFGHAEMRNRLLTTGDKELIEGNTWDDTLWGVCDGKGRNMLGVALMEIRKYLKEAAA